MFRFTIRELVLMTASRSVLRVLPAVVGLSCFCSTQLTAGEGPDRPAASIFDSIRPIHGHEYKCADIVRVVNSLRALGKERALTALRDFLDQSRFDSGRAKSIVLICRCLFDNPRGWSPPVLGLPQPTVSDFAKTKLPCFPLAFSDGVPFLVIEGYILGGRGEDPAECIKKCEFLALRKSDLPTKGFDAAARSLIASEEFSKLYEDDATRKSMSEMILKQSSDRSND
jgi:hypothetical protein